MPGILIENDVRHWGEPIGDLRTLIRYGLHGATQLVSGFASRRAPRIIAETEELRTMLVERRGIALELRWSAIPVPAAAAACGRSRGSILSRDPSLRGRHGRLSYLAPAIEGFARQPAAVELHLVGDGAARPEIAAATS